MTPNPTPPITLRDQLLCVAQCLALMIAMFPPLFLLADWLRYGGA